MDESKPTSSTFFPDLGQMKEQTFSAWGSTLPNFKNHSKKIHLNPQSNHWVESVIPRTLVHLPGTYPLSIWLWVIPVSPRTSSFPTCWLRLRGKYSCLIFLKLSGSLLALTAMLWSLACLPILLRSWILLLVLPKLAFLLWITQLLKRRNLKKPLFLLFLTSWIYIFSYEDGPNSIPVLPLSQDLCLGLSSHSYKGQSYWIISSLSSNPTKEAILPFWQFVLCPQSL